MTDPVTVRVYKRSAPLLGEEYQADIVGADSDHHGVGATPAKALFEAALHWVIYEREHP